jgi:hypothetical protein
MTPHGMAHGETTRLALSLVVLGGGGAQNAQRALKAFLRRRPSSDVTAFVEVIRHFCVTLFLRRDV